MPVRQVAYVSVDRLRAHPKNARTHAAKQIRQIANSIKRFGFTNPILVDEDNAVLAGHGRLAAAKLLGLREVPTLLVAGLTEAHKRAYLLADNKLAEKAGWDRPALAIELNNLTPLLEESGLDISLTGFEAVEIDSLLGDLLDPEADPVDAPPLLKQAPVTRPARFGCLDATACCVVTRDKPIICARLWARTLRRWSLPIPPTTYASKPCRAEAG